MNTESTWVSFETLKNLIRTKDCPTGSSFKSKIWITFTYPYNIHSSNNKTLAMLATTIKNGKGKLIELMPNWDIKVEEISEIGTNVQKNIVLTFKDTINKNYYYSLLAKAITIWVLEEEEEWNPRE